MFDVLLAHEVNSLVTPAATTTMITPPPSWLRHLLQINQFQQKFLHHHLPTTIPSRYQLIVR